MAEQASATSGADGGLLQRLGDDLLALDRELAEVDLLITQARAEAVRHEGRRTAATDKLAGLSDSADTKERLDLSAALITLTKRAALMETQVDVLEGKRRALARYRDAVEEYIQGAGGLPFDPAPALSGGPATTGNVASEVVAATSQLPAAVSRLVLSAQEDMRREIARAMHDGPAQSLTNIVLQAQIVERLVARDPSSAAGEIRQLTAMVQQTLDATKSFIFDVRPMVLDDLGLVPTLRRAARERGRRAGIPVEFDSMGQDRRLPMDLESGLFRMLDEAMAGYLTTTPERVSVKLDWAEQLEARVTASKSAAHVPVPEEMTVPEGKDLPPALAAMMEDRAADHRQAVESARAASIAALPQVIWREIQGRAASLGVTVELLAEGGQLRLVVDLPVEDAPQG